MSVGKCTSPHHFKFNGLFSVFFWFLGVFVGFLLGFFAGYFFVCLVFGVGFFLFVLTC